MTLAVLACCVFFLQSVTPEIIEHARAGAAALQQGHVEVAIREFRTVTELQPESAAAHANLGDAYFQNGDYDQAIAELETALRINPKLMGSHQTLGVALLVQGNAEAAVPHLEKTRTPELLGLAYLETGRLGSAIVALQAALERQPKDPDLLYYFGRATAEASRATADQLAKIAGSSVSGNAAAANGAGGATEDVVSLQKALAGKPDDPELLAAFSRAAGLASQNAFDMVLASSPGSARAHQVLAERYVERGQFPAAEREYSEALRLKPYAPHVHLALGNALAAQGRWAAAAAQAREETQLRPAGAEAFYRLGCWLLQLGDATGALAEIRRAGGLRPNAPEILLVLGEAAFAVHDTALAESSWKKLLAIDGDSDLAASAHLNLAALYRLGGDAQAAEREMAAYHQLKNHEER